MAMQILTVLADLAQLLMLAIALSGWGSPEGSKTGSSKSSGPSSKRSSDQQSGSSQ